MHENESALFSSFAFVALRPHPLYAMNMQKNSQAALCHSLILSLGGRPTQLARKKSAMHSKMCCYRVNKSLNVGNQVFFKFWITLLIVIAFFYIWLL